jgi:hypothetical protein
VTEPNLQLISDRKIKSFEFPTQRTECTLLKLHEIIEQRLDLHPGVTIDHLIDHAGGYPPDMIQQEWDYPEGFAMLQEAEEQSE